MKKEYIITRQGKDFVLYEGLLDEAHQHGLRRITTQLVQIPHEENGHVAVVTAEVETESGIFSGIGDASPNNVNRMIVPHLLRMAETRAKARALRDATNIGQVAAEELEDFDQMTPETGDTQGRPSTPQGKQPDRSPLNGRHTQPIPPEAAARADRLRDEAREQAKNALRQPSLNERWIAAYTTLVGNGWTREELYQEAWKEIETTVPVGHLNGLSREECLAVIEWAEREVHKLTSEHEWTELPDDILVNAGVEQEI